MPLAHYEEIHKSKVEQEIYERYQKEIRELETLGFHDLNFAREVTFPLSALLMFWSYFPMKAAGEIFRIEKPLRFVLLSPLLLHQEFDSYAHIFGLGTKFVTVFRNGGILYSCNYVTNKHNNTKNHIYRYSADEKEPIGETWYKHQRRIEVLEAEGLVTDSDLQLAKFERAMSVEDKILLSPF